MLNSNHFSDFSYYERFARYFNYTEPHNRFLENLQKSSLKKLKNLVLDALHGGIAEKDLR